MEVVAYHDSHPGISQGDVVKHFAARKPNPLLFNQATLSRHLTPEGRAKDLAKLEQTPTALTSKRTRIVTRPDVEMALVAWAKHMLGKQETFSGAMLVEKRAQFEERFDVPKEERLTSNGWVFNFTKTCVASPRMICWVQLTDGDQVWHTRDPPPR